MDGRSIVVMGGGPAGLSAAWKAIQHHFDVRLFEASGQLGGLSLTIERDGYRFDLGGHRFITRNQELLDDLRALAGDQFRERQRLTQILFQKHFFDHPLRMGDLLTNLNPLLTARCIVDYVLARAANRLHPRPDVSFQDWVSKRFGRRLHDIFFGPYTAKVWGSEPTRISAEWAARRINVPSLWQIIRQMLPRARTPDAKTLVKGYYYHDKGIGCLWERMGEDFVAHGGTIHLNSRVCQITTRGDQVAAIVIEAPDGRREVPCDILISTIALPDLVRMLWPQPPQMVLDAAARLGYRGIVFLFLCIDAERVMDNDALYVPEPEYLFFRVEQPKLWSRDLAPPGKTSLCLEIAATRGDTIWTTPDDELFHRAMVDLKRIGLLTNEHVVESYFVERCDVVYPLSEIDTEENRRHVLSYVSRFSNLHVCGRQGLFRYLNMDEVAEMGYAVVRNIVQQQDRIDLDVIAREEEYLWLEDFRYQENGHEQAAHLRQADVRQV
jgi:protoporphyrinogen oxidase